MPNLTTTLRKALTELEAERQRIEEQIGALKGILAPGEGRRRRGRTRRVTPRKPARRGMSAAARRVASQRMKAYWAKRREQAAKGKAAIKK